MWTKGLRRGPCLTMLSGTKMMMVMRTSCKEEISSFCHESQRLRTKQGSSTSPNYPEPCSVATSYHHIRQSRRWRQCCDWWADRQGVAMTTQTWTDDSVAGFKRTVAWFLTSLTTSHRRRRTVVQTVALWNHGEPLQDSKALINTSLTPAALCDRLCCFPCLAPQGCSCCAWSCSVTCVMACDRCRLRSLLCVAVASATCSVSPFSWSRHHSSSFFLSLSKGLSPVNQGYYC